ncbi:hypothetical protein Tco_1279409 [Tanacetum coccineum]
MITCLKNMEGWKHKDLKSKDFDSIKELFDKAFTRVNMFVDFRTELVEGSSKRAGEELEQESTKKQKSPSIVDWKIHKEEKKSYYQIVRADGKSQMYTVFSQMLKSFTREDLEDLYKLVKAKYGSTRPVEDLDLKLDDFRKKISKYREDIRLKSFSYNAASITAALIDVNLKEFDLLKWDQHGEVFSLKRSRDDKDKDQDPSAGSDRGTKRRKSSKGDEPSRDLKSMESKSTSSFKGTSRSQHKSSGNYAHAEEPSYIVEDSECNKIKSLTRGAMMNHPMMMLFPRMTGTRNLSNLRKLILIGIRDNKLISDHLKPGSVTLLMLKNLPLLLILNYRVRHVIPFDYFINNDLEYLKGRSLSRKYLTSVTKTKAATYEVQWIEDMVPNIWSPVKVVYDKHAYWGTSHWGPKHQKFYRFASNKMSSKDVYSKKRIIAVTSLKIMKRYDYGHLDEIEVRRLDQQLYKFKEASHLY